MGMRLTISAGVGVRARPERVWERAIDWAGQKEWIWATRVEGGQGVGATVTGWTGIGPVGFTDTMVITEWDPPKRCIVTHTGKVVRGDGVFEVLPRGANGEQSEFRWTEHLVLPVPAAIGKLASAVIAPMARVGLGLSLRRFALLFQRPA
jgi:hypothetical protein